MLPFAVVIEVEERRQDGGTSRDGTTCYYKTRVSRECHSLKYVTIASRPCVLAMFVKRPAQSPQTGRLGVLNA